MCRDIQCILYTTNVFHEEMKLEEEIRETCRTERERAFASQAEARDSYHRQYPEGRSESKKKSWFSVINCPTQLICTRIFICVP